MERKDAEFKIITKVCTACGKRKPLDAFRKYAGRSKDGYRPICKECQNAYDREYRAKQKVKNEGA